MNNLDVLLVDDLEADRLLIRSALAKAQGDQSFAVTEAPSMAAALSALAHKKPDVVLLDLMLPDSRGIDTVMSIRQATDAPIVVLTVMTDSRMAIESLGLGAHEYLLKSELRTHPLDRAINFAIERQHLEQALKRSHAEQTELQNRLLESHKMEAVGQLAGGVAHDFNNLLTVILGHTSLLLEQEPADDKRSHLQQISDAAERAASLTRQLLAFGRRLVQQPELILVNEVVLSLRATIAAVLGERIEIGWELDEECPPVWADPRQLEQVILNLVLNAGYAMKNGGRLTLVTGHRMLAHAETPGDLPPGLYTTLEIRDNGVGIAPEVMPRIFEPFFTTKGPSEGSGLGLSAVHGIVRASGGEVMVESEVGRGTSVRILLPAREGAMRTPAPTDTAVRITPSSILVVDDEAGVRNLVALALRRAGHSVTTAANGAEALELMRTRQFTPDLIVTDVVMPRMGGPALIRELQAHAITIPTLFISGYSDRALEREGILTAGAQLLQKPFNVQELLRCVHGLLR